MKAVDSRRESACVLDGGEGVAKGGGNGAVAVNSVNSRGELAGTVNGAEGLAKEDVRTRGELLRMLDGELGVGPAEVCRIAVDSAGSADSWRGLLIEFDWPLDGDI